MKKLIIALVAIATVFAGGMETSFAQSKKKKAPTSISAFLGGVSLRKATPAQLRRAFNRALARNPGAAMSFLSQLLNTGKISGSSLISLAGQAASANPAMAASIFNAVASRLSGDAAALKSLAQTIVAASPGSRTAVLSAVLSNTSAPINSNEI